MNAVPITLAALACIIQVSRTLQLDVNKRSLDSLARTGQLPNYKRSLASLAKSGQLPDTLVQEKRMLDVLEEAGDANSRAIEEQRNRVVQEIKKLAKTTEPMKRQSAAVAAAEPDFRDEFKSDLRDILDQYLKKFGTTFDPEKVELFLTNMADEVFDNHGVVSLDHIRFLIETGYFQPEMRDDNNGGTKPAGDGYSSLSDDYVAKRYMASLARAGDGSYWYGMADGDADDTSMAKRRYVVSLPPLGQARPTWPYGYRPVAGPRPKRNGQEEFIPVMQGGRSLQSIVDDLLDPAHKRYLGALSRSGWMPRGFASASTSSYHPTSGGNARGYSYGYSQRPPQASPFVRLGPLPAFRNARSFYMRNGRGNQCDVNKARMAAYARADGNVADTGRPSQEHGGDGGPTTTTEQTQADGLKSKRYLLLPAVDNILLRRQYPHLATNNNI